MAKIINRLIKMTETEVASDDLVVIQDVSRPKTKVITVAELIKRILRPNAVKRTNIDAESFRGEPDANGWSMSYNPDGKKVYRKRGTVSSTWSANQRKGLVLTASPIDVVDMSDYYFDGTVATIDNAITIMIYPATGSGNINSSTSNNYGGTVTTSARYSITLTEM